MNIYINSHPISKFFYKVKDKGIKTITKVYSGTKVVWENIKKIFSCFSAGYWINSEKWDNKDGWMN